MRAYRKLTHKSRSRPFSATARKLRWTSRRSTSWAVWDISGGSSRCFGGVSTAVAAEILLRTPWTHVNHNTGGLLVMAVALLQPDVKSNQDYSPGILAIDS